MPARETLSLPKDHATILRKLCAAATKCANLIGLPVVIEDDEIHAKLKATGHNLSAPAREWKYYLPELRVVCTAPVDRAPKPCGTNASGSHPNA